jgi:peptidoglycan/LPS O-acetylase OafA/YrhL
MQRLARILPLAVLALSLVALLVACGGKGGGY